MLPQKANSARGCSTRRQHPIPLDRLAPCSPYVLYRRRTWPPRQQPANRRSDHILRCIIRPRHGPHCFLVRLHDSKRCTIGTPSLSLAFRDPVNKAPHFEPAERRTPGPTDARPMVAGPSRGPGNSLRFQVVRCMANAEVQADCRAFEGDRHISSSLRGNQPRR